MSINATYNDGVFKPLEEANNAIPGKTYRIFSEEELRGLTSDRGYALAEVAERSFEFWDNDEDAVYDKL